MFLLRATADLAVSAQAMATNVILGSNITITITATNCGPGSASNVVLSLPAPVAATIVTASAPYTVYSSGRPGIKFNLGVFTNGASTNITVTLRTTEAGVLRALTSVIANADDVHQTNNVAEVEVLVVFPPGWSGVNFLPLPARDLAYDAGRNVFYISSGAETVAVVSPDSGQILASLFAGPATGRLKITDNGEFLYVTVSNGTAVARIDLASGTRDVLFYLGLTTFANPYTFTDLEPVPGAAHSIVIGQGHPSEGYATVTIYDDGVARPLSPVDTSGADYLEFANATNQVHANGRGFAYRRYRTMEITTNGVEEIAGTETVPTNLRDFEFGNGLFYATTGDILAPATGAVVGHINGLGAGTLVEPDPKQNRVFFLAPFGGTEWRLLTYEFGGLSPVASLAISNVFGTPVNLVRWGSNGFAFNTTSNRLYLVRAEARLQFTSVLSNAVVLAHQPLVLRWQLRNAGPAATAVTVSNRVPDHASFAGGSAGLGSVSLTNGHVLWAMTNLANNATGTATVQFLFTNNVDLLATNQSVAHAGLSPVSNITVTLIFPVLADNDHNGLGDTWELGNFGVPGVAPGADADGDGLSNQQEFLGHTDPLEPSNLLRVTRITADSNTVAITFFAARGRSYAIERGASVTGPWSDIRAVSGESARPTVTESAAAGPLFYRTRRRP